MNGTGVLGILIKETSQRFPVSSITWGQGVRCRLWTQKTAFTKAVRWPCRILILDFQPPRMQFLRHSMGWCFVTAAERAKSVCVTNGVQEEGVLSWHVSGWDASSAEAVGSTPVQGTKIPHAVQRSLQKRRRRGRTGCCSRGWIINVIEASDLLSGSLCVEWKPVAMSSGHQAVWWIYSHRELRPPAHCPEGEPSWKQIHQPQPTSGL